MEKFSFNCPACNKKFEYDEDMFGLRTCCPNINCDEFLDIPNGPPGSPISAPPPQPTVEPTPEPPQEPSAMEPESSLPPEPEPKTETSSETDYLHANDTQFREAAEAAAAAAADKQTSEDDLTRDAELDALAPKKEKGKKFTMPPPKVIALAVLLLAVLGVVAKSLMPIAPDATNTTKKTDAPETASKIEPTPATETNLTTAPVAQPKEKAAPAESSPTKAPEKTNATPAVAAVKPSPTKPAVTNKPIEVVKPPEPKKEYKFFSIKAISGSKARPIVMLSTGGSKNYNIMQGDKFDIKTPEGKKLSVKCVSIKDRIVELQVGKDKETTKVYAP